MTIRLKVVDGKSKRRPADEVATALAGQADYVLAACQPDDKLVDRFASVIAPVSSADAIVVSDPTRRARWKSLREQLPALHYLIASNPEFDSAIAISVNAISSHSDIFRRSESWCELAVRLADVGTVAFVASDVELPSQNIPLPSLTISDCSPRPTWLREVIQELKVPGARNSPTNLSALKAGMFLINDFFEESHSCSQSIEGLGAHHTGDYWHAILHRREPDYGNSKYWFRHVGRHPVFTNLLQSALQLMDSANGSTGANLERWKPRLVSGGQWDPIAFVDLCAAAEHDPELRKWCELVQQEEMLLLLAATYREMFA